jgi:toxin FitB
VRRAVDAFASESLFVSVLSIGEIAKGFALLMESQNKRALQIWLQTLERHYGDRLLPVDLETSRIWGELAASAERLGRTVPAGDGLIAAAARRHGLHVMTRNTADFEPTGVLLNPRTGDAEPQRSKSARFVLSRSWPPANPHPPASLRSAIWTQPRFRNLGLTEPDAQVQHAVSTSQQ